MMHRRLPAFLLMVALLTTGVASAAICQSFALSGDKTLALDWQVQSTPSYLLVDPNPQLTLSNRFRIGALLGLGFFTYRSNLDFQYVLGADFAVDSLNASAAYVNNPIQLEYAAEGQTLARGPAIWVTYSATPDITLKSSWFYGRIETGHYSEPSGYYGTVEADTTKRLDFQDRIGSHLSFSLAGSPAAGSRRYAVSLSVPIMLHGGDVQIVPFLGHLEAGATTGSYLDDLHYDFSSFTYGPMTSGTTGNTTAVVNALWKLHPLAGTNRYPIDTFYVGPAIDAALLWSPSEPFTGPETALTAGGAVGIELYGVHFELRFGYRSDVNSHVVWTFRVY